MSYTKRVLEKEELYTNTLKDDLLLLKQRLTKLEHIVNEMIKEKGSR